MIRHAAESDLPRILEIYDIARQFMRQTGNMTQWVNGYPSEPLHRIGSDGTHRGVLHECVNWAARRISHLRVDTHADNHVMQRCILREGFSYCGVIHVADGTPRVAFERI